MARLADILILRGTTAQIETARAASSIKAGEQVLNTDTGQIFVGMGGTTIELVGGATIASGEPSGAANFAVAGAVYLDSASDTLYIYSGSAWVKAGITDLSDMNGTLDDIDDGTTYGRVRLSELEDGTVTRIDDGTNSATAADVRSHLDDADIHREINDSGTGVTDLWSANKIDSELDDKADKVVPAIAGDIATLDSTGNLVDSGYRLDDAGTGSQDIWSANKTQTEIDNAISGLSWRMPVTEIALAPPASPSEGDRVLITGGTATGDFAGEEEKIAVYNGTSWDFVTPEANWAVMNSDNDAGYTYSVAEGEWVQFTGAGQLSGGDGIDITGNTVSVDEGRGLTFVGGELEVDVLGTGGLTKTAGVESDQLAILPDETTGVTVAPIGLSTNGAGIKIDDSTIEHTTGTLSVKDGGITAAKINASAVGDGLEGGAGTAISVEADATGGANLATAINVSANGVAVKIDDDTVKENTSNQLYVAKVDGGTLGA